MGTGLKKAKRTRWVNGQTLLTDAGKPPYEVPSMDDVRAMSGSNGRKVVSTFSGCGGSCLGFEMAGYEVVWANEFVPAAAEVYRLNHPGVVVSEQDVREVTGDQIREEAGLGDTELDVLEGSPPCAAFSVCGKRESPEEFGYIKSYSDTQQRVDDLFWEYGRLLGELQPRVFVAENVPGLVRGEYAKVLKEIVEMLRTYGYQVRLKVLDAQWLGVPQRRKRLIFLGVRDDIDIDPFHGFPQPLPYRYTINDAFAAPFDQYVHEEAWIERFEIGKEWRNLVEGEWSDRYFQLVRPHPHEPSPTVTQTGGVSSAAAVTNPFECRKYSLPELRRICSFPDDFQLIGSYRQQYERLGRAVPPLMMRAVAATVADRLL